MTRPSSSRTFSLTSLSHGAASATHSRWRTSQHFIGDGGGPWSGAGSLVDPALAELFDGLLPVRCMVQGIPDQGLDPPVRDPEPLLEAYLRFPAKDFPEQGVVRVPAPHTLRALDMSDLN